MGKIIEDVKLKFLTEYPEQEEFLKPFLNGFNINYAVLRRAFNTTLSVFILEPEDFLKESFGLTSEILLAYSAYEKTEARTIQAADSLLFDYPFRSRVDILSYFLVSENESIKDWLNNYFLDRQESRIIIPFSKSELILNKNDAWFVRNKLIENYFSRDLFGYTLPLQEDTYFFGRQQIIANYIDSIKRSENRGIFGLRKTGKTSILFKIQRIIKKQETIAHFFFYDCKSPSIRKLRWNHFLGEICQNIAQRFHLQIQKNFDEINIIKTFRHILKEVKKRNQRIVLVFDEIEYISFKSLTDPHWHNDFLDFWQTMWAAQTVHRNLTYIIAGVNPSVVEIDTINKIQNPLFGIVQYEYLKGLSEDEIRTMIKALGKRMGLNFEYSAITHLNNWYGGHPMLIRLACSWINKDLQLNGNIRKPVSIDEKYIKETEPERDSDLVFYCKHVVSELFDFYPEEYQMLELLASGQTSDFVELSSIKEYTKHLKSYGLIEYDSYNNPKISIPVIGRYVGIELARKEGRQTIYKIIPEKNRVKWIEQRKMSIMRDIRILEKIVHSIKLHLIFGPNSFPEADEFNQITIANTKNEFNSFINTCCKCFVESIMNYGKSINVKDYFWKTIKKTYPGLFFALERISVYRNEQDHLQLTSNVTERLLFYINHDLENQKPSQVKEYYFLLQQRVLDGLLTGIHIETNKFN